MNNKQIRIYTDGIFDLFHRGHIEYLNKCKNILPNVILIVGIINDKDATGYKRLPIYSEEDRHIIISNMKAVDEVIKDAPFIVTEEFMNQYKIDFVVHSFANEQDINKQDDFYVIPKKLKKFIQLPYYHSISTTDIINKIKKY
jgi:choline-phosphate cytidylyltransferase